MFSAAHARVWTVVAIHLAAGLLCCVACLFHDGSDPHFAAELAYMALLGIQMLLIGISAAISPVWWWKKSLLGIVGVGYLSLIAVCGSLSRGYSPTASDILPILGVLGFPILAIVFGLSLVQWRTGVRVILVDDPSGQGAVAFRFSIRHLALWTFGFAVALGVARWVRDGAILDGAWVAIFAVVLGVSALLLVWLLIWAVLGQGNPLRPLILVLFAAATIGLIPPCMQRDAPPFRYVAWASLTFAIAAIVAGTLLALRGVGFRWVACNVRANPIPVGAQNTPMRERRGSPNPA